MSRILVSGFHRSKVCSVSSRQMECEQPLASRRHRATSRYTFSVQTDCRTAPMPHQADVLFTVNFREPNPKEGYFAAPRKRFSKPQPLSHLCPKIRSISKKKYRPGVGGAQIRKHLIAVEPCFTRAYGIFNENCLFSYLDRRSQFRLRNQQIQKQCFLKRSLLRGY